MDMRGLFACNKHTKEVLCRLLVYKIVIYFSLHILIYFIALWCFSCSLLVLNFLSNYGVLSILALISPFPFLVYVVFSVH